MSTQQRTQLLTIAQFAEAVSLHEQTIRRWAREGKIQAVFVGDRQVRIPREELNRIIAPKPAWALIFGNDLDLSRFTDSQLHDAGSTIRPLFEQSPGYKSFAPAPPWSHVDRIPLRIALAAAQLPERAPVAEPHASARGCGECGVRESVEWANLLVNDHPLCRDCESAGVGEPGSLGPWKRIREIFGPVFTLDPGQGFVIDEVVVSFADLVKGDRTVAPGGTSQRWGYLDQTDKDHLAAWVVGLAPHVCPPDWIRRWGRKSAPVPAGPIKRTAVLV